MSSQQQQPHMVLMPSSGAGHIIPFLKVAGALASQNCRVTLITSHPLVSQPESALITRFLTLYPQVTEKQFHLLHLPPNYHSDDSSKDPFFRQWELIHRSLPRLSDILKSLSPPADALLSDISLMSSTISVTESLNIPNYVLFVSSARMFAFFAYYPALSDVLSGSAGEDELLEIPGLEGLPKSSVPPLLQDTTTPFATMLRANNDCIKKFDGFMINTCDVLEGKTVRALKSGKIVDGMPPIFAFLYPPWEPEKVNGSRSAAWERWLDEQLPASVVYVSFGSRAPLSREQTIEVAKALISCNYPFMWVAKFSVVDKDDGQSIHQVLGADLTHQVKEKGVVVQDWVDQQQIIGHKSVGGFVTHCGWNSILEASSYGVPMLGWPQGGDQGIIGVAMAECGIGMLGGKWGWNGEFVVKGEEIGMRIREMMESQKLRSRAAEVMEDIDKAVARGGVCDQTMKHFINKFIS
ncbi:unnamed protein product [Linum trigynum]|uniref:Glycosyltransferase n=1 Tax=Linum trigynum TaxID=586398 RepID=A0AAV2CWR7_9ROSI